jgi:hypothetical protein
MIGLSKEDASSYPLVADHGVRLALQGELDLMHGCNTHRETSGVQGHAHDFRDDDRIAW